MVATVPSRSADAEHDGPRTPGSTSAAHSSDARLGSAIANILLAEERERAAFADLLHEQPVQLLTAVGIRLGTLARFGGESGELSEQLQERVDVAIAQLRRLMRTLRGPELEEGLVPALSRELEDAGRSFPDTPMSLDAQDLDGRPSTATATICLRLVHAALASVAERPAPTAIALRLGGDARISCTLVATGEEPTTSRDRLQERLRAWLQVLADAGGSWTFRTNASAVSFAFELPSDL